MGHESSKLNVPVYSPPFPLAVVPYFAQHQTPIDLVVKESKHVLSHKDVRVLDAATKEPILKVKGKGIFNSKWEILDHMDNKVLTLRGTSDDFFLKIRGSPSDDTSTLLLRIEAGWTSRGPHKLTFTNVAGRGENVTLILQGKISKGAATLALSDGGPTIATIAVGTRDSNEYNYKYNVRLAPQVDIILVLTACIFIGERLDEKSWAEELVVGALAG